MSRRTFDIGLLPEAATAHHALTDALVRREQTLPCETDPAAWFSRSSAKRAEAVEACGWCSVRLACAQFAQANREAAGVWGGVDLNGAGSWEGRGS